MSGGALTRPGRRRRRLVWLLVAGIVVGGALALAGPGRVRLQAAVVLADALGLPVARPFATEVARQATVLDGVEGDLYRPAREAGRPPLVFVPGATPAGRQDPRAVALAHAFARTGRTVFIPELAVYGQALVADDRDRIARAVAVLAAEQRQPVVLFGTSFGGALGLLAAADDRARDDVALVASFGGYFDLVGVLQAATTGQSLVGDRRVPWPADPRAERIVTTQLLALLDPSARQAARQVLEEDRDPATLPEPGRTLVELLRNDDPRRTYPLASRLPPDLKARVAELSPSSVIDRVSAPVIAMHAIDDPAVPYGELLRLGRARPDARLITVTSFEHVDFRGGTWREAPQVAADLWRVWGFATAVLAPPSR